MGKVVSTFLCVTMMVLPAYSYAQAPVTYEDVAVIININDTNSVRIGEYFAQQRKVPSGNLLRIDVPAKETVSPEEFADLRAQVEGLLLADDLHDHINYLVTTKGVPLRVNHGGSLYDPDWKNASVDAELMLILGPYSNHIGQNTIIIPPNQLRVQPYYRRDQHFGRNAMIPGTSPPLSYGIFLVTRLTGLTASDVMTLIDRSGPHTLVDKDSALYVFDRDPQPIVLDPYDLNLASAGNSLAANGWNTLLNEDSVFVTEQRNVLGYASWGSNDHYDHLYTQQARPKNHWLPGSIAETYVSTSARNFVPGQTGGQSRIADLIAEGCTGASGYVFEPYAFSLTWVNLLFDRYTRGYNLAESFYMSNPTLSWMAVVVGDPKTSIITSVPPVPTPSIVDVGTACTNSPLTLEAADVRDGHMRWFQGSFQDVQAGGVADSTHPLWLGYGSGVTATFTSAGSVTVTFMNENFVGSGHAELTFDVLAAPTADILVSADTVYLDEGATVQFTAVSTDALTHAWDFGDGSSSSDMNPDHSYTSTGQFLVHLEAGNGGCTASAEHRIVVLSSRTTAVEGVQSPTLALLQNYPNPFGASSGNGSMVTTFTYQLPASTHVRMQIFDAAGRRVAELVDARLSHGIHHATWNASGFSAGVYTCRLEAGGRVIARQLTLLR